MKLLYVVTVLTAIANIAAIWLLVRRFPAEISLWIPVIGSQLVPILLIRKQELQLPAVLVLYGGFGVLVLGMVQLVR